MIVLRNTILYVLLAIMVVFVSQVALAQPTPTINYQGKITDNTGLAVPDGFYDVTFALYTAASGGSAVWTETRTGTFQVQVTNGLFSVMLGSVTSLASVDFNQPLYLGVNFDNDGEMTPRKILGTVPAAFEAQRVGGVASSSFLRSDQDDTASGLLTFTGGLLSTASSTIQNLTTLTATTTNLVINGENFTDLTGVGLTNDGGVLTVATSTLGLSAAFSNSVQLAALLSDETGTGNVVFSNSPTFTGTISGAAATLSSTLTMSGTVANMAIGSNFISELGTDTGISISGGQVTITNTNGVISQGLTTINTATSVGSGNRIRISSGVVPQVEVTQEVISAGNSDLYFTVRGSNTLTERLRITASGNVGIGTSTPSSKLTIQGTAGSANTLTVASSTGATTLALLANGNLELPGQLISAGIEWTVRSAAGNNDRWESVTYGNGLFVAVSNNGDRVMTSPDGINWTVRSAAGDDDAWLNITYGNGLFVAVGGIGFSDRVMTSPDGVTWTVRALAQSLNSVTYGNGMFIAVGSSANRVMTSPDGVTWTAHTPAGNNDSWRSVTYGNGLFVAVGFSGDRVMTSPDGINWTVRSAAGDDDQWIGVTYGNGLFVAVGTGPDRVITSPDGITWTVRSAAGNNDAWLNITYGNGLFVAVGTGPDRVMTSGFLTENRLATNNLHQGGFSLFGNAQIGTTTLGTVGTNTQLSVQTNGSADILNLFRTDGSRALTVLESGNVGIGTSSPQSLLHVYSSAGNIAKGILVENTVNGSSASAELVLSGGNDISRLVLNDYAAAVTSTNVVTGISNSEASAIRSGRDMLFSGRNMYFGTNADVSGLNSTAALTLLSGGNIGIGTTTPPGTLTVQDSQARALAVFDDAGNEIFTVQTNLGNQERAKINVTNSQIRFDNANVSGPDLFIGVETSGDLDAYIYSTIDGRDLNIGAGGNSDILTIKGGGNVGIGTTTPSQLLTVAGNVRITGALFDSNNASGTAGQVLQSTGSGFNWVATSTLGISGGSSITFGTDNQIPFTNSAGTDFDYSAAFTFNGSTLLTSVDNVGYAASFLNDGNNANRSGLLIQAGLDDSAAIGSSNLIQFNDGDGGSVGNIGFGNSALRINSTESLAFDSFALSINTGDQIDIVSATTIGIDSANFSVAPSGLSIFNGFGSFSGNIASNYVGRFINDGNNTNRSGLLIQAGLDDSAAIGSSNLIQFNDGDGGSVGNINFGGGNLNINAGSNNQLSFAASSATSNAAATWNTGFLMGGSNANIELGSNWLSGDGDDEGVFVNGSGNVGIGTTTASSRLTVAGDINLTTGSLLRYNGDSILSVDDTNFNVAFGVNEFGNSMHSGVTGSYNSFFGTNAGADVTTGDNNVLLGKGAGFSLTTESNNTFIGADAGVFASTGDFNIGLGASALRDALASYTIAIGDSAGTGSEGTENIFIGNLSGAAATGNNNIFLGRTTGSGASTGSNNILIGDDIELPTGSASNFLSLGNTLYGNLTTGNIGIGTTTPTSRLAVQVDSLSGAGTAALDQWITTNNSVAAAVQYGNYFNLDANNTATTTIIGNILRIEDDTTFGNTVRGLEIQTNRGSNTQGENTALSATGRTFGVRGITEGDAGGTVAPAGGFFETRGTTQGNAIRGFSSSITSATLMSLFHDTSTFAGTGLELNFGNSGGSFSSSTSRFVDFRNTNTSVFTVSAFGTTTIGDGSNMAGLQIGRGGLCVDNDGSCVASTSGQIASVSSYTGNSDLAEMYFSSQSLQTGEIVSLAGELSVSRANEVTDAIIGVVSTKPGVVMGADDKSTRVGETAYPIALAGRVPIQLSTENGPIKKGDQLALSSIPGVAMRATATGTVVGIALEDFDESQKYSRTFINQFGDDLVDPVYQPITDPNDPRVHDGCYYGGGADDGTPCVPLNGESMIERINSANQVLADQSVAQQLAVLAGTPSETRVVDGQSVQVGQIIMFVDLSYRWLDAAQATNLAYLMSTSSVQTLGENIDETLFDRLVTLAQNFVDGILQVAGIKTDRIEVKEELCVDGVCIDANDLRQLLDNNNIDGSPAPTQSNESSSPESVGSPSEPEESSIPESETNRGAGESPIAPEPEPLVVEEGNTTESLVPPSETAPPSLLEAPPEPEPIIEEIPEPEPAPEPEPLPEANEPVS